MSGEVQSILIIVALLAGIASGCPLGFVLGGVAVVASLIFWGPLSIYSMVGMVYGILGNFIFVAIPMFIFMARVLELSDIGADLYEAAYRWSGSLNGGLAVASVVACTVFAACTGVVAAGVITMALVALPQMLKYGYDKKLGMGAILAGGTLGQLIPPSVLIVLYGAITETSVGQMFAGGLCAGIILSGIFCTYILIRCYLRKDLGPGVPLQERSTLREKLVSLRHVVLPVMLIVAVLGAIFSGAATPTEASAVGAIGALVCAAVRHRLNLNVITDATMSTFRICGMVGWIVVASAAFSSAFISAGGAELVMNTVMRVGAGSTWGALIAMLIILFLLGMIIDVSAMVLICAPIFLPVALALGIDKLWFSLLFMVMLQIGYISPPFGASLFFMVGTAPKGTTTAEVYRSAWPFVGLQMVGLGIFLAFPESMMWLPHLIYK